MIISGTIALDPAAHAAATAAVRRRLEDLDERRRAAEQSVDHVLATWRGDAADLFRTRWEEWHRGALSVIDQLAVAADGLERAHRDLTGADQRTEQSAGRLTGRLG